ncbi:MAG: hypothetical protein IAF02_15740 [Anaerolineae bacterium]|nr:hypothetical protein [Anaerolineae bacterium]
MKRISWIVLLVVMFSLALTACSSSEPEEATIPAEPTALATETAALAEVPPAPEEETAVPEPQVEDQAAAEPEAEMENENEVALADLQLSSLDELTSYRYTMVMEMVATDNVGTEITQTMQMELAVSSDPPATSMIMTAEGTEGVDDMGEMEFIQIEDISYINMGAMGCMVLPADDNSAMSTEELAAGFSPESITEDLEEITLVGEETIDGITVLHYTYDETSLTAEEAADIKSLDGHIYIAKDGGFMVRSIIDVIGDSKFMDGFANENFQPDTATTHIEMNLTDVNAAVEILPPAACAGQELPEAVDWPMLEDASEVTSFAGILSYTTEVSGSDAIDFYNDAMTELGYTLDESSSFVSEGNGLLTYVNSDDESITVTISEDVDSGLSTVTILSEAGM